MLDKIKLLTNILVAISATKRDYDKLEHITKIMAAEVEEFPKKHFVSNNFPSLLIYNTPRLPEKFTVILNAHLDVTPAMEKLYYPVEKDGKLYGRGTYDMKAAAAVMMLVFKAVAKKVQYPLALQLVTDEEIGGHNGTNYQITKGVRASFVISGDASNFSVVTRSKGFYWIKVTAKGTTSHGAYPWEGDNAIWKMKQFLDKLEKSFPSPTTESWVTTINLANMETTNSAFNEIPSDCTIWLDVRYIPEEKEAVITKLHSLLPPEFTVEFILNETEAYTHNDNLFVNKLQDASKQITGTKAQTAQHHGGSDARFYTAIGIPSVEFGPKGGRLPDGNEWVDLQGLLEYYLTLETFLLSVDS